MTALLMVADHPPRIPEDGRRCDCGRLEDEHWSDPIEWDDEGSDPCRCGAPYRWHTGLGAITHEYEAAP